MKNIYSCIFLTVSFLIFSSLAYASSAQDATLQDAQSAPIFYVIKLHKDIDDSALRTVERGLEAAKQANADYCVLDLNTYGGAVDAADKIRVAILRAPFPVISFINIQAASAGALISIACDSIYMNDASSIGAATVVNGEGKVMPDKYQSFMRAMMRSTAETQHRDPAIAEAMVNKDHVLSLTPSEAIEKGYCEGMATSVEEVVKAVMSGTGVAPSAEAAGVAPAPQIIHHTESTLDKFINFLLNPILQGLLLMMIVGGIYFELQTPGIGFPLFASLTGAVFYFAPLYLEGLVQNWEIVIFIVGVILMALEVFVIPGFGVAGISGIVCMITGLAFAMVDNDLLVIEDTINLRPIIKPFAIVLVSKIAALFGSIFLASKLYGTKAFSRIALKTDLTQEEGFVGVETQSLQHLAGLTGVVTTDLKPSGTVEIDGKRYYAQINYGFAPKGTRITVINAEEGRLYCKFSGLS